MKRTVVWDVDDVLCPLMQSWLEQQWRPTHPGAPAYADLTRNPPHELLGVELSKYHASLDAFRTERYAGLPPFPAVLAFFAARGERYRHVALTATPRRTAPLVASWVLDHFGDWIRTFAFVPSHRPAQPVPIFDVDKGAWLETLGRVDLFLDDQPSNVAAARARGIESWLVAQPWNQGVPIEELLERL